MTNIFFCVTFQQQSRYLFPQLFITQYFTVQYLKFSYITHIKNTYPSYSIQKNIYRQINTPSECIEYGKKLSISINF